MSELDPALRCDSCQILVKLETLHQIGCCPKCGNRRVRNLAVIDEKEREQLKEWGFTEFADEYQVVSDE